MVRTPHLAAVAAVTLVSCLASATWAFSGIADTTGPDLQTHAEPKQTLDRIRIEVRCVDEACDVVARGVLRSKHPNGRDGPAISIRDQEASLDVGERETIRLRIGVQDERHFERLIERGGSVKGRLKAFATDESGNETADRRRVKFTA
jgi:hypothetical protein